MPRDIVRPEEIRAEPVPRIVPDGVDVVGVVLRVVVLDEEAGSLNPVVMGLAAFDRAGPCERDLTEIGAFEARASLGGERLGLQRFFDQPSRMILRNLERQPARALLTVVGIASSAAILITGVFWNDSIDHVIRVQYGVAQRENLTVSTLVQLGVPPEAITTVEAGEGGTTDTTRALAAWAREHPSRVVVVVATTHARRYRRALLRVWPDEVPRPLVTYPRDNPFKPEDWWTSRRTLRDGIFELQKLAGDYLWYLW